MKSIHHKQSNNNVESFNTYPPPSWNYNTSENSIRGQISIHSSNNQIYYLVIINNCFKLKKDKSSQLIERVQYPTSQFWNKCTYSNYRRFCWGNTNLPSQPQQNLVILSQVANYQIHSLHTPQEQPQPSAPTTPPPPHQSAVKHSQSPTNWSSSIARVTSEKSVKFLNNESKSLAVLP